MVQERDKAEDKIEEAVKLAGVVGTVIGITEFEAEDETEDPMALRAVTMKVYEVLFVKPVTTAVVPFVVVEIFPGLEVIV